MNFKNDSTWLIILALAAFLVFANSLGGEFVYDDHRQITRNPLIQEIGLAGKALTSDVWAFKGDGRVTASNYWRPTFTAWHILNFQVFGLNPFGWHLTNVLLHVGVCLLGFVLLRRWQMSVFPAFAVMAMFAVHPIHVESVAWISGSPDLLFGLALLGSLYYADVWAVSRKNSWQLLLSLSLYALALGAKEVALLCVPVYFLLFYYRQPEMRGNEPESETDKPKSSIFFNKTVIYPTVVFAILAAIYFFARWAILGAISQPAEEAVGFKTALISAPSVFVFYLKQTVLPLSISPSYPLRPIEKLDLFGFFLPLFVSLAAVLLFYLLAKRSFIQKIGLALFLLPLLPTFNISAFIPEHIVHDRYLYLPLFGFLLLIVPYLQGFAARFFKAESEKAVFIGGLLLCVPLALQTFLMNRTYSNDAALWSHAVTIDKESAHAWSQFGAALADQGKTAEAVEAFNNSLDVKPTAYGYLGRAQSLIRVEKFEEAVWDLQTVTEMKNENIGAYILFQSYEALAVALERKKDFQRAENTLREARKRLPIYHAALTEKIAVILYQQNRKHEALKELESAQTQARVELLPISKAVFLRLGMLYAEFGEKEKARSALQEYLKLTNSIQDKLTQNDRRQAAEILRKIN